MQGSKDETAAECCVEVTGLPDPMKECSCNGDLLGIVVFIQGVMQIWRSEKTGYRRVHEYYE
jgi:hypothetical protein